MSRLPPDIVEFLSGVTPFSSLPADGLEEIAASLSVRYEREGAKIGDFGDGDEHSVFIIRKGAVELSDDHGILEQRGETDLFGHQIDFSPPRERYRVKAAEDCLLWEIEAQALRRIGNRYPELNRFWNAGHGQRLRDERGQRTTIRTIGALDLRRPVTTHPDATIAECAQCMAKHQVSCLPIVDRERLVGIVTDRDLRNRVLARHLDPQTPVARVMTPEPATVTTNSPVDGAVVEMMRLGIHHLPVVDENRKLAGVLSAGDLMRVHAPHPLRLVRDIQRAENAGAVATLARRGPAMLAGMVRAGSGASEVGRIAGRITDACTQRLLGLAVNELGQAPMQWTWLAFGSQARLEQGLISDQDNGLLLEREPDAAGEAAWFKHLAETVCTGLDACGYEFCKGGVMASGEWRMSREHWEKRFAGWIDEPEPKSVMQTSIFFDLRAVAGNTDMAMELQRRVLKKVQDREIFLRFLAAESIRHKPPIGLFRQFVQEHGGGTSQGLNLKKRGVIPIVDLARVRALESGLEVIHTEERLLEAARIGKMAQSDADDLVHALKFIGDIRLAHQVRQLDAGRTPDHLVEPGELSGLHRRYLRSAFGIVSEAQKALAQRYMV